jgi:hypothetical protein
MTIAPVVARRHRHKSPRMASLVQQTPSPHRRRTSLLDPPATAAVLARFPAARRSAPRPHQHHVNRFTGSMALRRRGSTASRAAGSRAKPATAGGAPASHGYSRHDRRHDRHDHHRRRTRVDGLALWHRLHRPPPVKFSLIMRHNAKKNRRRRSVWGATPPVPPGTRWCLDVKA